MHDLMIEYNEGSREREIRERLPKKEIAKLFQKPKACLAILYVLLMLIRIKFPQPNGKNELLEAGLQRKILFMKTWSWSWNILKCSGLRHGRGFRSSPSLSLATAHISESFNRGCRFMEMPHVLSTCI